MEIRSNTFLNENDMEKSMNDATSTNICQNTHFGDVIDRAIKLMKQK